MVLRRRGRQPQRPVPCPPGLSGQDHLGTSRTLAMAILRAYPLATSLKRRKVSIWSSNFGTRYMG